MLIHSQTLIYCHCIHLDVNCLHLLLIGYLNVARDQPIVNLTVFMILIIMEFKELPSHFQQFIISLKVTFQIQQSLLIFFQLPLLLLFLGLLQQLHFLLLSLTHLLVVFLSVFLCIHFGLDLLFFFILLLNLISILLLIGNFLLFLQLFQFFTELGSQFFKE